MMGDPPVTLESLDFEWGDAYLISYARDQWAALRRGTRRFLTAQTLDELAARIETDDTASRAPRDCGPPPAQPRPRPRARAAGGCLHPAGRRPRRAGRTADPVTGYLRSSEQVQPFPGDASLRENMHRKLFWPLFS